MGVDVNCCRRPETARKKDLKTYRGISQKKIPDFPSFNEKEDKFGTYHPTKTFTDNNSNNYFNSIYATNNFSDNNYQKYSTYNIEPVSNQIYTTPNYFSQPSYDNTQYINSYTTYTSPNAEYLNLKPTPQYSQLESNYQLKDNYSSPIIYNFSEPTNYANFTSPQYINSPYEYTNSSSTQYYDSHQVEYNNYNYEQNTSPIEYTTSDNNLTYNSYSKNETIYSDQYAPQTIPYEEYTNSNTYTDYSTTDNYNNNYESKPQPTLEYSPSTEFTSTTNNYNVYQNKYNTNKQIYSEPTQIKYYEPEPIIQRTVYVCKPKKYIEKVQYTEPETQTQQTMYSPNNEGNKRNDFKIQKEPEKYNLSENKPQPFKYFENQENELIEDESEIDNQLKEEENNSEFNDIKVIKSTNIEKNQENTVCKVPGFISNFISKIFK